MFQITHSHTQTHTYVPFFHTTPLPSSLSNCPFNLFVKDGAQMYSMGPNGVGYGYWGCAAGTELCV